MEHIIDNERERGAAAELKDVKLVYHEPSRETLAVDKLSLRIERGEFLSVVGPSGCGKTSVLKLLTGLCKPTEGSVTVMGSTPAAARKRIGYMLQRDALFEWRTIARNAELGLELRRELNAETREKVREMLEKYGLGDFAEHYPDELSGGMRQKAALIRTLAPEPELLLLDEPFSALDHQTRLLLEDEVYGLIRLGGRTAVLVTHDISEAVAMSDRVAVFTGRPASVRRIIEPGLCGLPGERRADPRFSAAFESIWKELRRDERGA